MALSPGTRLGVYEVTAKIGEGGMGEVYQARDTKLDRDVALKVLPEAFTSDPDRLTRFEREAKVLASLNHTNIGHIYGLEDDPSTSSGQEGVRALVLELVDGPTLADRIAQGPIPIDESLSIANQIIAALEAAHEAGVVHRDLKPANIKVRRDGTVKVLDFGLAKAFQTDSSDVNVSASPTVSLTAAATQMGMVIGTAAYMAPEQAKGQPVDKRADVWAFGVVLFEMLTGDRPFKADDVSLTLARVLDREPDWDTLDAGLPPALRVFLERCLAKDPKKRVRDIGDVGLALAGAFEGTGSVAPAQPVTQPPAPWQRPASLAAALLAAVAVGGLSVWALMRPDVVPADIVRFRVVPPASASLLPRSSAQPDLAISPDGTQIVYRGNRPEGGVGLYLRPVDQLDGTPLRGTQGGEGPFVSPDGAWVGFLGGGRRRLLKVSIFGGPPVTLAESQTPIRGAVWGADDQIVFGSGSGLFTVSSGGGVPEALTTPTEGESGHLWPALIPGRDAIVFVVWGLGPPLLDSELAVLDLATGAVTRLGLPGVGPRYLTTGHLVYAAANDGPTDGSVWAVPFDADALAVSGSPVPLLEGVMTKASGAANVSIADNGRLVYVSGVAGAEGVRSLHWVDREGQETPIPAPARSYAYARVSPDGSRVALDVRDQDEDVWVWSLPDGPLTRLTFDASSDQYPHWTPEGDRVVFSSFRDGASNIYWKAADGTGATERVTESDNVQFVNAVTSDGTQVIARAGTPGYGSDLVLASLTSDGAAEPLVSTPFFEGNAALSPDGAWVAFESDESGAVEVFVRPFPDTETGRWQVSTSGGLSPVWSPDGSELFYLQDTQLMAVPVQTDDGFTSGTPDMLFDAPYYFGAPGRNYDVAPDGRFLMIQGDEGPDGDEPNPEITVVLNWLVEVEARVPTN